MLTKIIIQIQIKKNLFKDIVRGLKILDVVVMILWV
jgi:hypothetical protein